MTLLLTPHKWREEIDNPRFRRNALAMLILAAFTLLTRAWIFGDPVVNMDEQFYFTVGDRILHGQWPFIDIWDRKPIGLFLIYAFADWAFPNPVVGYQLLAAFSVWATSCILFVLAQRLTSARAALAGAAAYPAWLTVFGGIAGQSPTFYNLPMIAAAAMTLAAIARPNTRPLTAWGCGVMLVTGVAIQIKYTAVFEGIFFGLSLMWAAWRADRKTARIMVDSLAWIASALVPTIVAFASYAAAGHGAEFAQANFLSVIGDSNPFLPALGRLAGLLAGLVPLGICAWFAWRRRPASAASGRREVLWIFGWLGAALFGFLLFGVWNDHYVLPLLPPLCLAAAIGIGSLAKRKWLAAMLVVGLGAVGGFVRSAVDVQINGTDRQIARLAAIVQPHLKGGCLYVNEDLSILYYLTESCLPTRFIFPQHLALSRYENALGIDQMAELNRLLARRPDVIVISTTPDPETRFATRQMVEAQLRQNYTFVGSAEVGETPYAVFAARSPTGAGKP